MDLQGGSTSAELADSASEISGLLMALGMDSADVEELIKVSCAC